MSTCPRSLLLGLLITLYLHSCAMEQDSNIPQECCFKFFTRPIPVAEITEYKETGAHCPKPGVIFYSKKGPVCMDPSSSGWVKQAMDKIDRRTRDQTYREGTESKPPPTPKNVQTDPAEHQDGSKTEDQSPPTPENMQTAPATHQDGSKTEDKSPPKPKNVQTDPAEHQDGSKTEDQSPPTPENMQTAPATHQDGSKTEGRTQYTPEIMKTDSAEPNWFCQTEL